MKKEDIKPGIKVWLITGSPAMVVKGISDEDGLWICSWFDGSKPLEKTYSSEQIIDKRDNSTRYGKTKNKYIY